MGLWVILALVGVIIAVIIGQVRRYRSRIEIELKELYSTVLSSLCDRDPAQARKEVKEAIEVCKEQGLREGTHNLPEKFGDLLLQRAEAGEPKSKKIVETARREGATDEDIREWWNFHDLQRRMVLWSEDLFRLTWFLHARKEQNLSPEDAAAEVRKTYPMYGDPVDTKNASGDDKSLPHELRGRVDRYRELRGAERIKEKIKIFSSYNAFVRDEIRKGNI